MSKISGSKISGLARACASACASVCLAIMLAWTAQAADPKPGGVLRMYHRDSPGSPSILEESSNSVTVPFMALFNNLVVYDQNEPRNSIETIRPDLATSWSWSADNTALTFKLRQGVKWHDGKPFTARDVACTWDLLLGRSASPLRSNLRGGWYHNLKDVVANGDFEVTFQMNRPQPAMLALLASGYSAIYPCHVTPREMRSHPIGTGPFRFVEFKANESIKLARNPDYWKPGRPYLDGIEFTIITNRSTALLAFATGKVDMTFPNEVTIPLLKGVREQSPAAVCALVPNNCAVNVIVNRERPPFDNPEIRRALALTLDRKSFIDILTEGQGIVGASMQPPPEGVWGLPPAMLADLPGYGPDVETNRAEGRRIMEKFGYGPNNRLRMKVSHRNIPTHRDPGIILADQLKHIYIDAELDPTDTASWFPKIARKDYTIGPNITCGAVDDPDQKFYEDYACKSARNFTQYCNPALEPLFDRQSQETDLDTRRKLVWDIDRTLQQDMARPILYHYAAGTCWAPAVRGYTPMVNSIYNGPRFEDVWLDR